MSADAAAFCAATDTLRLEACAPHVAESLLFLWWQDVQPKTSMTYEGLDRLLEPIVFLCFAGVLC